ncbi:hypothetical protein H5410_053084 [Solanum commersonii]|uniref:Uncharacterized protein n=1 Tax=Solanum commersonii TaxID=4109 RepID=A0A9J5X2J3_SOLCO|nr:hypothetical protein H5410_053084 [Solanum commersonii]
MLIVLLLEVSNDSTSRSDDYLTKAKIFITKSKVYLNKQKNMFSTKPSNFEENYDGKSNQPKFIWIKTGWADWISFCHLYATSSIKNFNVNDFAAKFFVGVVVSGLVTCEESFTVLPVRKSPNKIKS